MKICVLDAATLEDTSVFSRFNDFGEVTIFEETKNEDVKQRIKGFDIVIDNKAVISQNAIEDNDSLKLIALLSTGTNVIDMESAKKKGIAVCNVAGYSTASVLQHTFAILFELLQRLNIYDDFVKSGKYSESCMFTSYLKPFEEINAKTWGIVGLGTIGTAVAKAAQAFGADVVYYSISGKNCPDFEKVEFNDLLKRADIISLHCALSKKTKNLFSSAQFNIMKKNSIIINVARGSVINENDLAEAIDSGKIGGACLDVFENEPIKKDNALLKIKNRDKIVLSPHIAWASIQSRQRLVDEVYKNVKAFICGEKRNRVI